MENYLSFREAKAFVYNLNLKHLYEWQEYCKSGKKPENIPANPSAIYADQGWKNFYDFFGFNRYFRPFEEAKAFARMLNLKSVKDWQRYCKSGNKPYDIPASPYVAYNFQGWKGFQDFLGYTFKKEKIMSYPDAKAFVQKLNLKSEREWIDYCKSGNKPANLPKNLRSAYHLKGWKQLSKFFGCPYMKRKYLTFEEARTFVRKLNFKNKKEWEKYSKSSKKPTDLPSDPSRTYRSQGWISYPDFFGYPFQKKVVLPFEEARAFARSLNLKSYTEWEQFCKSGKPNNVPLNPNIIYKNQGWNGYEDFLGFKKLLPMTFEEARSFARTLNLKSKKEWFEFARTEKRPRNIPINPADHYQHRGWKGFPDFLGYKTNIFLSFEEARAFVRKLNIKSGKEWRSYCRSGKRPANIPADPEEFYKSQGWKGRPDFFGFADRRNKLPFEEARAFVRKLKMESKKEWKIYCKSSERPAFIPKNPNIAYKSKGWQGFPDFLGYRHKHDFMRYKEAKAFMKTQNLKSRREWVKYVKKGNRPDNIPAEPEIVYKGHGWKGFPDFLGYKYKRKILFH